MDYNLEIILASNPAKKFGYQNDMILFTQHNLSITYNDIKNQTPKYCC